MREDLLPLVRMSTDMTSLRARAFVKHGIHTPLVIPPSSQSLDHNLFYNTQPCLNLHLPQTYLDLTCLNLNVTQFSLDPKPCLGFAPGRRDRWFGSHRDRVGGATAVHQRCTHESGEYELSV